MPAGDTPQQELSPDLKKAIETFYDFLNIKDEPQPSDAIFILGNSTLGPVEKAAELYKAGFAPKIAFISTGGKFGGEKVWGMPENEKYKETLLAAGIPEEAILTEGLTTNTLAETQQAVPFMEKEGVVPRQLILVSRPVHQRRAYATFREQHPEISYLNCPADERLDPNDPGTRERLVQEAERLLEYSKKGDIETPEISTAVLRAAALIRMDLKDRGTYKRQ